MAYFKVGGTMSFETIVRAKADTDAREIEEKAIRKAWREGAFYLDSSNVSRCNKEGDELETE